MGRLNVNEMGGILPFAIDRGEEKKRRMRLVELIEFPLERFARREILFVDFLLDRA